MVTEKASPPAAEQGKPVELHPKAQARPTKSLPTTRISFKGQLDLLRAYGAAAGLSNKAASRPEVAKIAGMAPDTVTLANAFFLDVPFIVKTDAGLFTATAAVRDYVHAHQWQPDTAATKLSSALARHWAYQTLEPRLKFAKMAEPAVIQLLSETAAATPEYAPQLRILLEYLKVSGLVVQDGMLYSLGSVAAPADTPAVPATDMETPLVDDAPPRQPPVGRAPTVNTNFTQQPEGHVQFGVSVSVDMAEMSGWAPDRIAAFFGGIAQVLAAKGRVEAVAGRDGVPK